LLTERCGLDPNQFETQSKAIFKRLEAVEAPPYLARRVVAKAQERKRGFREIHVWRWVAALSFTAAIALTVVLNQRPKEEQLFALKPYVIHVNLEQADMQLADSAEVELPDGVTFVSKNEEIKTARKLRLPVTQQSKDHSRLPFVVLSEHAGTVAVTVRIFDANDQLIRTKTLNLNFRSGV
jgi:hypothetical protein